MSSQSRAIVLQSKKDIEPNKYSYKYNLTSNKTTLKTQRTYYFGFNGKEKDNEIYGEGNTYAFEARTFDSRIAKFFSIDPDFKKFPIWSPYSFAKNNPIRFLDEFGKGPKDKIIIFTGAILVPVLQKPTATMTYIHNKVSQFVGSTTMYPTVYANNDDNYVANAMKEIENWKKANPDGVLTIMGYSYGGVVALKLARELDKKDIRVNLLITLDAANGTGSDKVDRTVTKNVDFNLNYYQTNEEVNCGEGGASELMKNAMKSKGGENKMSEDNYNTRITNINETDCSYEGTEDYCNGDVNHYNIDDKNKDNIVNDVKKISP